MNITAFFVFLFFPLFFFLFLLLTRIFRKRVELKHGYTVMEKLYMLSGTKEYLFESYKPIHLINP